MVNISRRDVLKLGGISLAATALAGCAPLSKVLATITPTPTLPPSQTPSATVTPSETPSPTPTPTATPTPIDKATFDVGLEVTHEQLIDSDFMGVEFNIRLICDQSIGYKVEIRDGKVLAKVIAEDIYDLWVDRENEKAKGKTFEDFMADWAIAQSSGLPKDWEKVAVSNVWADNSLSDNFDPQPYKMAFMYKGDNNLPIGTFPIRDLWMALIKQGNLFRFKNRTVSLKTNNPYFFGAGTGILEDTLIYYGGRFEGGPAIAPASAIKYNAADVLARFGKWLMIFEGQTEWLSATRYFSLFEDNVAYEMLIPQIRRIY